MQHRKTVLRNFRLPQCQKLIFDMFIFFAIFVRFLEDARLLQARKASKRLLQDTQGVRTTDVRVCHPRICLSKAARLLQDHHARMLQNLCTTENRTTAENSTTATRLHCGYCTTSLFVLQICTTILRQPSM